MKNYTEIIESLKKKNGGDAEDHKRKAITARKDADALRALRVKAIEEGRQEDYINICNEIDYHEGRALYEEQQSREAELPTEAIRAAWEEYVKDYNREVDKKEAALRKIRKQFAEVYLELVALNSEGNREYMQLNADLRGRRIGTFDAIYTLTQRREIHHAKREGLKTAEDIIAADGADLDQGRRENLAYMSAGGYCGSIYEKSASELYTEAAANREPEPVFHYPIDLPMTEEEEHRRRMVSGPYKKGYLMNDLTYKEATPEEIKEWRGGEPHDNN